MSNPSDAPETLIVHAARVACEGIGGALGHPKVYLQIGDEGFIDCPYCDRRFVLDEKARHGAGAH